MATRGGVSLAGICWWRCFLFSHQQANPQAVSAGKDHFFSAPEEDAKGAGYQLLQSKIAVGSGGFWAKDSVMASQNQLGYIPVRIRISIMSAWLKNRDSRRASGLGLYMALLLR